MTMGSCTGPCVSRRVASTSSPLMPGMLMSRRIRDGTAMETRCRASGPLDTPVARKPSCSRRETSISRMSSLSSTTRTAWSAGADMRLEQLQDALVLVRPARLFFERVALHGIDGQLPVLLAQLDEALHEADAVLEVHVVVDHPVADQERRLQPLREVD